MSTDNFNSSDPNTANHHWFPFLRYQEQCKNDGKEPTINEWLKLKGKLKHQDEYEIAKAEAIIKVAEEKKAKEAKAAEKARLKAEEKAAQAAATEVKNDK